MRNAAWTRPLWLGCLSAALAAGQAAGGKTAVDPYSPEATAREAALRPPVAVYTRSNAPATPKLAELRRTDRVSQHGITWKFREPAPVGQFVNGDWYVVGPVTIESIDPKPLHGAEIPAGELDGNDLQHPEAHRVRNGFMLNPPARAKVAYDSGIRNWFDAALIQKLPVAMKPGDSLVATISMPKGLVLRAQLRNEIERGVGDGSPVRTAAVLTCVDRPLPPDTFRPAFCDRGQRLYRARGLRRELLPRAASTPGTPDPELYIRFTARPWVGTGFFGFEAPVENMPQYGREYGRVAGISALLLATDLPPERKEPLLINYVQVGIDLAGMVRAGHPGWTAWGGHGSGRKLPIVFAGLLLGDEQLANISREFPKVNFGEDEQTAYGDCWTGAKVVFTGHSGIDPVTGRGRSRDNDWGPYEHQHPSTWSKGQHTSEAYRRCCSSIAWVAQALTLRLMGAEKAWNHDAFFDYVDRWMFEDDGPHIRAIREATGRNYNADHGRQGQAWDDFVNEMWKAHRPKLAASIDGWKRGREDSRRDAAAPSSAFVVKVDGEPLTMHEFPRGFFGILELTKPVEVEIQAPFYVRWVDIRPKSAGVAPAIAEDHQSVRFRVDKPSTLTVEFNGKWQERWAKAIHLFANPPEKDPPKPDTPGVRYFGPGTHAPGRIELKDGETLYLAPGSWVKGIVHSMGTKNVTIRGRGVLDAAGLQQPEPAPKSSAPRPRRPRNMIYFEGTEAARVEGITLVNSQTWTIHARSTRGTRIQGVNILNGGGPCTSDGIDLVSSSEALVEDVFIRTNDDNIAIKAMEGQDVRNVTVRRAVLWNEPCGNAMEIGFELRDTTVENIRFEDIDIIRVEHGAAISIHNGDRATVRNVVFENIRVEDARHKLIDFAVLYGAYGPDSPPREDRSRLTDRGGAWDGVMRFPPEQRAERAKFRGHIRDIQVNNLHVVEGLLPFSIISGFDAEHAVENVVIRGMKYIGQPVRNAVQGRFSVDNARNIEFR